jgi:hypothetical protein
MAMLPGWAVVSATTMIAYDIVVMLDQGYARVMMMMICNVADGDHTFKGFKCVHC